MSNPSTTPRFAFEQDSRSTLRVPRPIDVYRLNSVVETVFTARDDADFQIEHLVASNVTASAKTLTVYLVPDGGAAGSGNLILAEKNVPANDCIVVFDRERQGLLQPGMTLQAFCSTNNAVNMFGHGFDYQGIYS